MQQQRSRKYITYSNDTVVPHIETDVRVRSRYGGVGVTAGDGMAEFFEEPDEPPAFEGGLPFVAPEEPEEPVGDVEGVPVADPKGLVGDTEGASAADPAAAGPDPSSRFAKFANFRAVYESADGKLCVFEDAEGHLVAVNAARLV